MRRIAAFAYGAVTYVLFLATLVYAIGFVTNIGVPKSIDSGEPGLLGEALAVNLVLLAIFALQHSVMARKGFKERWKRIVPASLERNTYVLATNIAFIALFLFWRPMTGIVWDIEAPEARALLWGVCGLGWALVVVATFMINHFDLFGLRQAWLNLKGQSHGDISFRTPMLYRLIRHPIQAGFLVAFWTTPTMTAGHLLFAIMCTGYILVALQLEERDLVREHGEKYEEYRRRVRGLLPIPR